MDVDVSMDLNIAMQKKGIVDDLNYGGYQKGSLNKPGIVYWIWGWKR